MKASRLRFSCMGTLRAGHLALLLGPFRAGLLALLLGTAGAGLLTLLLVSCSSDDRSSPFGPAHAVGAIEGRVTGGGTGVEAIVVARPHDGYWGQEPFRVRTDPSGRFRIELPSGIYQIAAGPVTDSSYIDRILVSPDITVGRDVEHMDLAGGRVDVRIAMPADLEGRGFDVRLAGGNGLDHVVAADTVRSGVLESTFPLTAAGMARVEYSISRPRWVSYCLPGASDPRQAQWFSIPSTHPTLIEGSVNTYASIRGAVHGSWEAAGASAPTIFAFSTDSTTVGATSVNRDGSYSLDVFAAQPVKLCSENGVPQWFGGETFAQAAVYELHPGDRLESISLVESGILCTLAGIENRINIRPGFLLRSETGHEMTVSSSSTQNGRLALCNLRAGRYYLRIFHDCYGTDDWSGQWFDGADSLEGATPIDLTEGELAEITFHIERGGRIEGRTLRADGSPLGRNVILFREAGPLCGIWSDEAGSYSFVGLDDGSYKIAMDGGYDPWWYPGTSNADSAAVLTIRDHAALGGIDWRLP